MIKPTSKNINILAMAITLIIFFIISFVHSFWVEHDKMKFHASFNSPEIQEVNIRETEETQEKNEKENDKQILEDTKEENAESNSVMQDKWTVEIPEIGLVASINEGTSKEVMDQYVGHFEETQIEKGNIGLAAHNRGYPINFFQDLKKLKEGSEIIYKHGDFTMTYVVKTLEIIENTDWTYLKNTEDNRITLITCVENEPKYRRCIQGIEKVESEEF